MTEEQAGGREYEVRDAISGKLYGFIGLDPEEAEEGHFVDLILEARHEAPRWTDEALLLLQFKVRSFQSEPDQPAYPVLSVEPINVQWLSRLKGFTPFEENREGSRRTPAA